MRKGEGEKGLEEGGELRFETPMWRRRRRRKRGGGGGGGDYSIPLLIEKLK